MKTRLRDTVAIARKVEVQDEMMASPLFNQWFADWSARIESEGLFHDYLAETKTVWRVDYYLRCLHLFRPALVDIGRPSYHASRRQAQLEVESCNSWESTLSFKYVVRIWVSELSISCRECRDLLLRAVRRWFRRQTSSRDI